MGSIAAICEICKSAGEGQSVSFGASTLKPKSGLPADALANARLSWFCKKHVPLALKYKDLTKAEALEKIWKVAKI